MKEIKKPEFMLEALNGRRGFIAIWEVLIALIVFFVGAMVMGIIEVPMLSEYMLKDAEFMSTVSAMINNQIDTATYYAQVQRLVMKMPEWIKISVLLLEILLILTIIAYCRFVERRKVSTMGFRKKNMVTQYLLGALGGILFFSAAYLICVVTGSIRFRGFASDIAPVYVIAYLAGYMIQGMAEEVLCRGYLFVSLSRRNSVIYSAILSALFFSLLHGSNSGVSLLALTNIFLFGFFAALLLVHSENIWIVGAFHSLWNFVQGNLYGIQVSGSAVQPSVFVSENHSGMSFVNGGSFGVEGGIGVTVVLVFGTVWLLHLLEKQGKLIEWRGLRPVTNEYNNYPVKRGRQVGYENSYPQDFNGGSGYGENVFSQDPDAGPEYGNSYSRDVNAGLGYGNGYPRNTNAGSEYGNVYPGDQVMSAQPKRRENMGTEPGETPWRPENKPKDPERIFDASYFKE